MTAELKNIANQYQAAREAVAYRVMICAGTGCVANGAMDVHQALMAELEKYDIPASVELDVHDCEPKTDKTLVSRSGCQGFCQMGPLLNIEPLGVLYVKVRPGDIAEIVEKTFKQGEIVERLLYHDPRSDEAFKGKREIPFYTRQTRRILKNCGEIDAEDIQEYIAVGGYAAAETLYQTTEPKEICQTMMDAGLLGRGGGGFPTGRKWELTRIQPGPKKYVICNGDEGDPGAFMDRSVMEGNPHAVIEGMLIAALAIGSDEGFVYVRMEYPLAVERLNTAVQKAEQLGLLGENIFGTDKSFKLTVMEGAGAFVCGEETALMMSIEGRRGMPNPKPPFPAEKGLWDKPTVINNVETLAAVPLIFRHGVDEFRSVGTATSPGTKTFALTGHIANTGLIEVPLGTLLREIVYDIGGGVTDARGNLLDEEFKAVQIGGPSGGCLTQEHLDLPLDFDSLKRVGAMVGSGGLVVMNQATCMVSVASFFMQFTQNESCGKCTLCREGTKQMLSMLNKITEGEGRPEMIPMLQTLGKAVQTGSLCGLGKTAPSPVLSTIAQFGDEYAVHVNDQRCPAGQCKALAMPEIVADLCKGCTLCARKCPVDAITGAVKELHEIDPEKCIRCGVCAAACKFNAIVGV